jgi:oligoribonuclease NrnB/cAMP/cGMP phosphodiesterase (DHH superfamily)
VTQLPLNNPLVFYHHPCSDGYTAGWVVRRKYPNAEMRGAAYGITPLPEDILGRDVVLVDFSWKRQDMITLLERARRVVVLDHHESARDELAGLVELFPQDTGSFHVEFDMARSGARMAWDYFFPGYPAPDLVRYVEDRDLWRKTLPNTEEYNARVRITRMTWDEWDRLNTMTVEEMVREGRPLVRQQEALVQSIVSQALPGTFQGFKALFANSPLYQSEAGNALAQRPECEVAVVWFQDRDGRFRYSLRSVEGGPNVATLARTYGGGGHARAAGFLSTTLVSREG